MKMPKLYKNESEIKAPPELRIVFEKELYAAYMVLNNIFARHKIHPSFFVKELALIFCREFHAAENKEAEKMLLKVIQSSHGLYQTDLFKKDPEWENVKPVRNGNARIAAGNKGVKIVVNGKRKSEKWQSARIVRKIGEDQRKKAGKHA